MKPEEYDVLIIGGGLAGLACAYHLGNRKVLLCEKEAVLGGRLRTHVRDGLAYDMGAVLAYQADYVPFPISGHPLHVEDGPIGVSWKSTIAYGETVMDCLGQALRDDPSQLNEVREFQKGEASIDVLKHDGRVLLNAFFQGIHPGEIEEYIPPRQRDAFERYMASHYHDGNYGLVDDFRSRLAASILLNSEVKSITRKSGFFLVTVRVNGERKTFHVKAVIAATTATAAVVCLSRLRGIDLSFLRSIKYGRFVTVAIGTRANFSPDFSYIVTPMSPVTTVYKMRFPESDMKIFLFFFCDKAARKIRGKSDAEVVTLALREAYAAGLPLSREGVVFSDVVRWKEGGTIISPKYYQKWKKEANNPSPGVFLAGDYLYGAMPYGMEAALKSARETAKAADRFLAVNDTPLKRVVDLGLRACKESLPMICHPPFPEAPYGYGDLVPLGFLLRALKAAPNEERVTEVIADLEELLHGKKQDRLWAFHSGRLVTATDSSLMLLGAADACVLEALDDYYDGCAGYFPQLWSATSEPGRMEAAFNNRHWCQVDYATSCLIRYHRRSAGLRDVTPLRFLEEGFDSRGGLFFANPYMTDWFLALSLGPGAEYGPLRARLLSEVIGTQNDDGSFGGFDRFLSTALAVLTLCELGCRSDEVRAAVEFLRHPPSSLSLTTFPFYSADRIDLDNYPDAARLAVTIGNGNRIVKHGGEFHAITLYEDGNGMITSALVYLACVAAEEQTGTPSIIDLAAPQHAHPRYRCETVEEYVGRYALPPYLENMRNASGERG